MTTRARPRRHQPVPSWMFWLAICLAPIYIPPLLVFGPPVYYAKKLFDRYGPISHKLEPIPLPKRRGRRRSLSVEPSRPSAKKRTNPPASNSQVQEPECGFWKLPFELREMIWRHLLVTEAGLSAGIYLYDEERRLRANLKGPPQIWRRPPVPPLGPANFCTGVLRTNRRFYLEGMDILYRYNRFDIFQANALVSFVRIVSPSRLSQITRLDFQVHHFMFTPNFAQLRHLAWNARIWKRACHYLEAFTGLRDLKVLIRVVQARGMMGGWGGFGVNRLETGRDMDVLEGVLEPLKRISVREGGSFVVVYPWPKEVCDSWPGAEFVMRSVEEERLHIEGM